MYLGRGVPPDGLRLMVKGAPMPHLVRYLEHPFDRPLLDETRSDKKYRCRHLLPFETTSHRLRSLPIPRVCSTITAAPEKG